MILWVAFQKKQLSCHVIIVGNLGNTGANSSVGGLWAQVLCELSPAGQCLAQHSLQLLLPLKVPVKLLVKPIYFGPAKNLFCLVLLKSCKIFCLRWNFWKIVAHLTSIKNSYIHWSLETKAFCYTYSLSNTYWDVLSCDWQDDLNQYLSISRRLILRKSTAVLPTASAEERCSLLQWHERTAWAGYVGSCRAGPSGSHKPCRCCCCRGCLPWARMMQGSSLGPLASAAANHAATVFIQYLGILFKIISVLSQQEAHECMIQSFDFCFFGRPAPSISLWSHRRLHAHNNKDVSAQV